MAIGDIQARLNEAAKEKATKDFNEARRQIAKILEPFAEALHMTDYSSYEERQEWIEKLNTSKLIGKSGYVRVFEEIEVPTPYVKYMQAKASEEFIAKVDELQDQIDSLYSDVENMR